MDTRTRTYTTLQLCDLAGVTFRQADLPERVAAKIAVDEAGCWIWTGAILQSGGYGELTYKQRVWRAHRFTYEHLVGPIPDGLQLDHLCRVPPCVNPAHLEPVTNAENMRRAFALQTHCKWGHEFTPENTHMRKGRPHSRECRACAREKERRKRAAR